jgi:tripartite-type tricarboxylate transporter receptor subunit TctC
MVFVSPCGSAEDPAKFPSKPITLIVPYGAGGAGDLSARKLADLASRILGQPIVVECRTGGGGVIGTTAIAKAPADGYTVGIVAGGPILFIPLLRSVPYRPKDDFTYFMEYTSMSYIFSVRPDSRWKTLKDFIEDARRNPGKLSYAVTGPGGLNQIFMEQVFSAEKVKVNCVPTAGGTEAAIQTLGGHVDGTVSSETAPHVAAGKLRGLAVQGEKRLGGFPEIPTFLELGYKVDSFSWIALIGPKDLEPRIFKKLWDAFKKAHEDPSFKEFCATIYLEPTFKDSETFKTVLFKVIDEQRIILKELGLTK